MSLIWFSPKQIISSFFQLLRITGFRLNTEKQTKHGISVSVRMDLWLCVSFCLLTHTCTLCTHTPTHTFHQLAIKRVTPYLYNIKHQTPLSQLITHTHTDAHTAVLTELMHVFPAPAGRTGSNGNHRTRVSSQSATKNLLLEKHLGRIH